MISFEFIAKIRNDYSGKFGIPRQSGLVDTPSEIIFEKKFRSSAALKGIEGFSHLWILWYFSEDVPSEKTFTPTVRPPRLGGNTKMGVFATRSPNRPNRIGLSCVQVDGITFSDEEGPILRVRGADLMDGTPIFDIKPYIPYTDSVPNAVGGFSDAVYSYHIDVRIPDELLACVPNEKKDNLLEILRQDPRPAYQKDNRIYTFEWANYKIKFFVENDILTVQELYPLSEEK